MQIATVVTGLSLNFQVLPDYLNYFGNGNISLIKLFRVGGEKIFYSVALFFFIVNPT